MLNHHGTVFLIWNKFQLNHFKRLLIALPRATLLIVSRKNKYFVDKDSTKEFDNPVIFTNSITVYDTVKDFANVIVVQTMFEDIYKCKSIQIVMLQYGYAKDKHNYGPWRSLANLNLVYGEYAQNKMVSLSPTKVTGCPKYDNWFEESFHHDCAKNFSHLKPLGKNIILFAPSWGVVSSFTEYIDELQKLTVNYTILVKVHHNSLLTINKDVFYQYENIHFFFDDTELLTLISISDVVISDYSGAIFDALFCKKPVILLSLQNAKLANCINDIGSNSLEISKRDEIGYIVDTPEQLRISIHQALSLGNVCNTELYDMLFYDNKDATGNVIRAMEELLAGKYKRNLKQYVSSLKMRRKLRKIAKIKAKANSISQ